jgi:hypothetical protein
MPVVFAQGMRRSGTTVLFDLLWEDGRFDCWYEPLNRIRPARGGGSKIRKDTDYMEKVAKFRRKFLRDRGDPSLTQDDLNWGSPRAPELEFERAWPPHVRDFVRAMVEAGENPFIKFTRASHKVAELAAIRKDAFFLHLVRDPRSVATSHLFRTAPHHRERILAEKSFFTSTTGFDQWRAETMARILTTERREYRSFAGEPAYLQIMLVWKELYLRTRDDARRHFKGRHALVWHEEVCRDPAGVLRKVHALWDGAPKPKAIAFARENVRIVRPPHEPDNPLWALAMERLGLQPLVEECESDCLRG